MKQHKKWFFILVDILSAIFGVAFEVHGFYYIFYMLSFGYSDFAHVMMTGSFFIWTFCIILHTIIKTLFDLADRLEEKGEHVWQKKKHFLLRLRKKRKRT